jgi:uncharacterized membrane protein YfcA
MLELLIRLALGIGIGAYGTLIGVGGGFLMVPLLIIAYHFEPSMAAGTSLFFVFFSSLSGTLAYLKQSHVDVKVGLMFTLLTIPGAILGAFIPSHLESNFFNFIFAGILIVVSIYLVLKPLRKPEESNPRGYIRKIIDFRGREFNYSIHLQRGFLISFLVGFAKSIFGIGGGIILVPTMISLLGFPVHIATATSYLILVFSSLAGSATHAGLGNVNFEFAIIMGVGAIIGAQIGASISRHTRETAIKKILGLTLLVVAGYLLIFC